MTKWNLKAIEEMSIKDINSCIEVTESDVRVAEKMEKRYKAKLEEVERDYNDCVKELDISSNMLKKMKKILISKTK